MVKTLVRASCLLLPLSIYPPHGVLFRMLYSKFGLTLHLSAIIVHLITVFIQYGLFLSI